MDDALQSIKVEPSDRPEPIKPNRRMKRAMRWFNFHTEPITSRFKDPLTGERRSATMKIRMPGKSVIRKMRRLRNGVKTQT